MSKYQQLKEEAYASNMKITQHGLAIYTFGNVSAFDAAQGVFAIKPSGVPYEQLKVDDMVVVDLDNQVVEGSMKPSTDTKTHTVLYRNLEGIGGVAHTHSTYAVAWSQAMRSIPIYGTTHADYLPGNVPCTQVMSDEMIEGDYEKETGNQILQTFENLSSPQEYQMVLIACHGPFTWGKNAAQAVYNSVVLEELAKMAYLTEHINSKVLPMKDGLINKHYGRKHGKNTYYGQK